MGVDSMSREKGALVPLPTAPVEGSSPAEDYALQPLVHARKKTSLAGKTATQSSVLPVEQPVGDGQIRPASCISPSTALANTDEGILLVEASAG
ncbi:hypothetical protein Nepgr_030035 [Nepenthes gracilis]|uniref:Uncharacterized protein n=1 Tax=Nepenthes gracilis TaxID=150966 RepID=A0AAD3TF18_NEPGR|nr:hypothetical protein Nepgr_030035 [Nepenthes gracilis]